jgi:hypothetical protein
LFYIVGTDITFSNQETTDDKKAGNRNIGIKEWPEKR